MDKEEFKTGLFEILNNVIKTLVRGKGTKIRVDKDQMGSSSTPMNLYMDEEVKQLISVRPYHLWYIPSLSSATELVLQDLVPTIEADGSVTYTSYDADSKCDKPTNCDKDQFCKIYGGLANQLLAVAPKVLYIKSSGKLSH